VGRGGLMRKEIRTHMGQRRKKEKPTGKIDLTDEPVIGKEKRLKWYVRKRKRN